MPLPDHLKPVVEAVLRAPRSLPEPWIASGTQAVGGLTDVGFIPGTDFLLVLSSQGRGIYDCLTGQRVARDRDEAYPFDTASLTASAFADFAEQTVHTAGIHGGGLALTTHDGWSIADFMFDWPEPIVTLSPAGLSWEYAEMGRPTVIYRLPADSTTRAFGFSPTGRSIVLASSSDLQMISRA
jgi:hypothetical protein